MDSTRLKNCPAQVEILDDSETPLLDKREIPFVILSSSCYAFTVESDHLWSCQDEGFTQSDYWGEKLRVFGLKKTWRKIARSLATTRRGKRRNRHLIKKFNAARWITMAEVCRGNHD